MLSLAAGLFLASCLDLNIPERLRCAPNGNCPSPYQCSDGVCVRHPAATGTAGVGSPPGASGGGARSAAGPGGAPGGRGGAAGGAAGDIPCSGQTPAGDAACGAGSNCTVKDTCAAPVAFVCRPAGAGVDGSSCGAGGDADCSPGFHCLSYNADVRLCRRDCAADADCPASWTCSGTTACTDPAGNKLTVGKYCQKSCAGDTPAGDRSCGSGFNCVSAGSCATPLVYVCKPVGSGVDGATCLAGGQADCAQGFRCVTYNANLHVCRPDCAVDQDCPAGSTCSDQVSCSDAAGTKLALGKTCRKSCGDISTAGAATCGPGFKCSLECPSGLPEASCVPAGTLTSGPAGTDACAAGYQSVAGVCQKVCKSSADCPAPTTCSPIVCLNGQNQTVSGFTSCQ
ncbi:MAG TPA: hypothetical protein VN962_15695 [Polyangia bacterium]|nr:hypothetical protein [Polyangia bacterium]